MLTPLFFLCFTTLVSVTGFYTDDEPNFWVSLGVKTCELFSLFCSYC